MSGFHKVVHKAWNEHLDHTEPYQVLFHKLKKTVIHLTGWSRGLFSEAKVDLHAALLVIFRLDTAKEMRQLSVNEHDLCARLKKGVISLAVLERSRKMQCARITNLGEGDANTKKIHRCINARRKNHIHRLKHGQGWVTEHETKEKIILHHFIDVMGKGCYSSKDFNWDEINLEVPDLDGLDRYISEKEVKDAIDDMPSAQAPRPDDFTGAFFKKCRGP